MDAFRRPSQAFFSVWWLRTVSAIPNSTRRHSATTTISAKLIVCVFPVLLLCNSQFWDVVRASLVMPPRPPSTICLCSSCQTFRLTSLFPLVELTWLGCLATDLIILLVSFVIFIPLPFPLFRFHEITNIWLDGIVRCILINPEGCRGYCTSFRMISPCLGHQAAEGVQHGTFLCGGSLTAA